jgi:hypothetical protein
METEGGSGGECNQSTTRDVRLLSRALAESWEIPGGEIGVGSIFLILK